MSKWIALFMTVLSSVCFAQVKLNQSLNEFNKIMNALEKTKGTMTCDLKTMRVCEFDTSCEELRANRNSSHIYTNSEGRKVANPATLDTVLTLGSCAKTSPLEYYSDDLPTVAGVLESNWGGRKGNVATFEKLKSEVQQLTPRSRAIFSDARQSTIAFLKSRQTDANKKQIQEMIKRIESVEFKVASVGTSLAEQGCELPNAFYEVESHQITLCPQFLNYPDALLHTILTHELAHSIDACAIGSEHDIYRKPPLKMPPPFVAVPLEKNPFASTMKCLQSPQNLNIKMPKLSDIKNEIRESVTAMIESNFETADNVDVESAIETQLERAGIDKNVACYTSSNTNFSREAFADWVASQVQGQKLAQIKDPQKAKTYAFETQLQWLALGCPLIAETDLTRLRVLFKDSPNMKTCLNELEKIESQGPKVIEKTHPEAEDRSQKIFMTHPSYRKAMGCSYPATAKYCQ